MSKKTFKYQHIYSVVDGKAPSATTLLEGEIAVNAFAGNEKLFIKNSSGDVVDFPRSYSIKDIDEDMEIIAAALNELNDRKADWVSAVTSGAVDDDSNLEFYNRSGQTLFEIEIPGGNGDELTIHSGKDAQDKPIISTLIYLKDVSSGETLPANVQKRYRLVDANGDNIVTASGDTSDAIDIYKDSSVLGAYIGTSGDSIESDTGIVTKLEVGDDWSGATSGGKVSKADFHFLNYIYFDGGFSGATISGDGEYKLVNVDLGQATAGVYGSGVTMTEDGAVTGVVDSASSVVVTEYTDSGDSATTEEVLTVGEDGFKVEHIQEAIDAKADIWRRLYHVTSGKARTDIVESATTLEYYNLSGDTLFQIELPIDDKLDSGSTNPVQNSAITVTLEEMQKVTSAALNDLNMRKLDISAHTLFDEQLFVANGEFVESSTTAVFKNLSGDTLFEIPAGGGGGRPINEGDDIKVISGETADTISVSADTVIDSASTRVVQSKTIYEELDKKLDKINFLNQIYPKGSIYITYDDRNPSTFIGGEWELISKGKALFGYDPDDADFASGATGGGKNSGVLWSTNWNNTYNDYALSKGISSNPIRINSSDTLRWMHKGFATLTQTVSYGSTGSTSENVANKLKEVRSINDSGDVQDNSLPPYQVIYVWRRTDDAPVAMMLETVTLERSKDVLWEGSATGGTITLTGGSMADYDAIEFLFNFGSTFYAPFTVEVDALTPSVYFTMTSSYSRWVQLTPNSDMTALTFSGGTEHSSLTELIKVVGIKDAYVSRTDITTEINSGSTDDKAASAKAVYDAFAGIEFVNRAGLVSWNKDGGPFSVTITCEADEVPLGKGATNVQTEDNIGFGYVSGDIIKNSDTSYTFTGWANGAGCNYLVVNAIFVKKTIG